LESSLCAIGLLKIQITMKIKYQETALKTLLECQ